jgi:hypothetical protein
MLTAQEGRLQTDTDASLNTGVGKLRNGRCVVLVCPGGRFLSIPEPLSASKPAKLLLF